MTICPFAYLHFIGAHVSHLENVEEEELNRLLGIVVDVENLFMCVHKEEDADTKQVYFYLFKVILQCPIKKVLCSMCRGGRKGIYLCTLIIYISQYSVFLPVSLYDAKYKDHIHFTKAQLTAFMDTSALLKTSLV